MDTSNTTSSPEFSTISKPKNRLQFPEDTTSRETKPHSSSGRNSSWYDGHRGHRRERDPKGRDRSDDRESWSSSSRERARDRDKDRSNHSQPRENFREEESRERFREEQESTYPSHAYGSADAAYMDSSRKAALSMMSNISQYGLFATMNSSQWAMNPLDGTNVAAPTLAGMAVNPSMDMNASTTSAGINPFAFMGMAGDPNLFGMMGMGNFGQFGMIGGDATGMMMVPAKEIIHLSKCVLYPPNPNTPPPTTREKPQGCKTVFVGGLPENASEEIVKEVFERCGKIQIIRMSKKNFCHIRFTNESYIDNAIFFSGYHLKIDNKDDAPNSGCLLVDYAQARDDRFEYECRQRSLQREARHREKVEQGYYDPPTPPPVVDYSDHEASILGEKLRSEETFQQALSVLVTWLERGECNKKNAGFFYSMIQSANSHVRRLMNMKRKYEDELDKAKIMHKQQMQGIFLQFNDIVKVFNAARLQKVWDHFTKAQRKNIELWKKQTEEIKNAHVEEVLNDRIEDEMDVSDHADGSCLKQNDRKAGESSEQFCKTEIEELNKLREENDSLRCQLEASQNEAVLLRSDGEQERNIRERQLQALRQALQNMQKEMLALTQKRSKDEAELKELKSFKIRRMESTSEEMGGCSHDRVGNKMGRRAFAVRDSDMDLQRESLNLDTSVSSTSNNLFNITAGGARLIGLISTFLSVHPFGASIDYICSYLHQIDCTIRAREVEALMKKFPSVFKEESTGIGASLEKKWTFCGFKSQI